MHTSHKPDPTRLVRYSGLVERAIVSNRTTLRRRIANDGFPPPLKLGKNSLAWRLHEIEAWLEQRTVVTVK